MRPHTSSVEVNVCEDLACGLLESVKGVSVK